MNTSSGLENRLWAVCIFIVAGIAFALGYPQLAAQVHSGWVDPDGLSHGYLALATSLYLVYRNAPARVQPPSPQWTLSLAAGLFFCFCMSIAGWFTQIDLLNYTSFVLFLVVSFGLILGTEGFRTILPPALIIAAALPASYVVLPWLQLLTVKAVSLPVKLSGMIAYIEGPFIHTPKGIIWVKEGCSGHKYFVTAGTLTLIFIGLERMKLLQGSLFLAGALLVSVLANWVRVLILIFVGYTQGLDHPLMDDHDNLGWVVFALMFVPAILYARRAKLSCFPAPEQYQPLQYKRIVIALASCLIVPLAAITLNVASQQSQKHVVDSISTIKEKLNHNRLMPVEAPESGFPDYQNEMDRADYETYYRDQPLFISIRFYSPNEPSKGIHANQALFDADIWTVRQQIDHPLAASSFSFRPQAIVIQNNRRKRIAALAWLNINGINIGPNFKSRIARINRIWSSKPIHALYTVYTYCSDDCTKELKLLEGYISENITKLVP